MIPSLSIPASKGLWLIMITMYRPRAELNKSVKCDVISEDYQIIEVNPCEVLVYEGRVASWYSEKSHYSQQRITKSRHLTESSLHETSLALQAAEIILTQIGPAIIDDASCLGNFDEIRQDDSNRQKRLAPIGVNELMENLEKGGVPHF